MSPDPLGMALLLLGIASMAAVQARAARGAPRHRVHELCRDRGVPELADEIVDGSEPVAFIAATIVVVAATAATLVAAHSLDLQLVPGRIRLPVMLLWMGIVWFLLVAAPMLLARTVGPRILVAIWPIWRPLVAAVKPFVVGVAWLANLLSGAFGRRGGESDQPTVEEEVRQVVDDALRDGRLEGAARDMIEGVMDLRDARVAQIMTPRTSMVTLPVNAAWSEVLAVATESAHTRMPVWDRSPDDVIGILHSRELLTHLAAAAGGGAAAPPEMRPLLRPPYFVPESMSVQNLLREFQRTHTHMAVVTDEFGGVSGVVTIEDALEEIVGEIADEHDEAFSDGLRQISEGVCEAMANVRLEDLARATGLDLPMEADYESVGGFVFHHLGRIPVAGERFESHGGRWEVLAATLNRVDRVRVTRLSPPD
ncbi:MAG: HlyC/CorC family transporter [Planctomycetota bacterium]|nr:MAG: HlyC/CorC family transporter [Planctomycetota bacterium]